MESERQQFQDERNERKRLLLERQAREIEDFDMESQDKKNLDELHFDKIELSDVVYILNVGDYIGESTRKELNYARELGKKIKFLEDHYID